ncbi:MAG: EAL domain-containing protein [Lachnospiraceae bacterium]|nr:EAL domain-containing protein [Lachnospiraceae bacterium]
MIYNIDFDIAATIIFVFIGFYIFNKKGLAKNANRIFLLVVCAGLIAAVADIVSSIANSYTDIYGYGFRDFWNYLYLFIYDDIMPFSFLLYILFLLGIAQNMNKRYLLLLGVPTAVEVLLLAFNPRFHWIFYYDENRIYTHGTAFVFLYIIAFVYMLATVALMVIFRQALTKRRLLPLIMLTVFSILPMFVQVIYQHLLIELFFQALGMLGILFSIEDKEDIINPITKVRNRFAFLEEAQSIFRSSEKVSMIIVKIANINFYNSTVGIQKMYEMQAEVAKWLDKQKNGGQCYDCENGHYALICARRTNEEETLLLQQIKKRFQDIWGRGRFQTVFPVQVGILHLPEEIQNMEQLLLVLDTRFAGEQTEELVAERMLERSQRVILIERLIKEALQNHKFQVWYQPIWNSSQEKITSAEALIRLIDDELGFISPEEFIPIAEQNGTIHQIGEIVFEETCRFYQEQCLEDEGIHYIEVNLSTVQCMNKNLPQTFASILRKYKLDASHINLEITESATVGNSNQLTETIETLRRMGFTFSLDDYGTGYSNLSYMYDMPFSIIKLDKSILWNAVSPKGERGEKNAGVLLENTVHMFREMNYKVLVEGVETVEQKMLLEKLKCHYFQGYYFSKPVPKESFLDFVKVVNA